MFEKLNYKQEQNDKNFIIYRYYMKDDKYCIREITFDLQDKGFIAFSPYELDNDDDCSIFINLKELQAINKQIEELGWNER